MTSPLAGDQVWDARSSTPAPPKAKAAGTPSTQQQQPRAKKRVLLDWAKGKAKPGPARGGTSLFLNMCQREDC